MQNQIDGDYVFGNAPFNCDNWTYDELSNGLFLSCSPGLSVSILHRAHRDQAVLGFIYDPHDPNQSIAQIAEQLFEAKDSKELSTLLKAKAGCYVVIAFWQEKGVAFTDAASLRKIYYMEYLQAENYALSSSADLLAKINNSRVIERLCIKENPVARIGGGGYLPGSLTQYNGIKHLIPHHYLSLPGNHAIRYYPDKTRRELGYSEAINAAADIVSGSAKSLLIRYPKIAIAMTAGYDSRTSLAACAGSTNDKSHIKAFTFKYPYLAADHPDIKIAQEVCEYANIAHQTIHVDIPGQAEQQFASVFGPERPLVVSTIADIYRIFYRLPTIALKPWFMLKKECIPKTNDTYNAIEEWFSFFHERDKYLGYSLFDLFYWENRIARWGTAGFSGSDLHIVKLNLFNSLELLDIVLSINPAKRRSGEFSTTLVELLYPGLTDIPFNPSRNIRDKVKHAFNNVPGESWLRFAQVLARR